MGKNPSEILLDNSWHFAAMKGINNEIKEEDLISFIFLYWRQLQFHLYLQNKIKIYIHTIDDKVIYIGENVHIPKSYHRFDGLIEKLFLEKIIQSDTKNIVRNQRKIIF